MRGLIRILIRNLRSGFAVPTLLLGMVAATLQAQSGDSLSAEAAANQLDRAKRLIAQEVTTIIVTNELRGSYTTVWRQYEDLAIEALGVVLPLHLPQMKEANLDRGKSGSEKNRLADLALVLGTNAIEISIKTTRRSDNPENDMGTFRDHLNRKRRFAASFTLWIRYDDSKPDVIQCDRAFFDRTWRFVGRSTLVDGVKYRKKDGNMRPKPWGMFDSGAAYWPTEEEFEAALRRAEVHRANELIKEYLDDLSESDQRLLYEKLQERFSETNSVLR